MIGHRLALTIGLALASAIPAGLRADEIAPASAGGATSTAASIGLLPVPAIAVDLDALPGAGKAKGKDGDLAALQQLWGSFLKGAGFNVIEFDVDARDLGERGAGRVARLCVWAKQNDVRLAPTLQGAPEGKPLPADYANLAASFVGKVIADLGAAGIDSYSQIVFYQLERSLNQPASHGPIETVAAGKLLEDAARSVRAAEQAGLAQSGMQPTPLLVPASFDYELIRRGAIAQTPISDESYGQAYDALRDYLLGVLGSASVEAVSVQWFPGSLSSEGVDRLPDLVNRLQTDLPGKLLIVDTGYSSAAGTDTAQARYYQIALTNLCDLRASQGVDSPFAGIVWRSAVDGAGEVTPVATQPKAADVTKSFNDPKAAGKEARSWLESIQSRFGLLARAQGSGPGLTPKVAFRVMSGLEAALAQSPQASDALAAAKELAGAGQAGGLGQAVKSRLQTALFGMLDAWISKSAEDMFTTPSEATTTTSGLPAQLPDIQVHDPGALPASVTVGPSVLIPVTLFNAGGAMATDALVYLLDRQRNELARTNPISVPPGGQTTVELTWRTPLAATTVKDISVEAFCSNDADPSPNSNRMELGDLQVNVSGGGGKPPGPKLTGVVADIGTRTLVMSPSSPSTSPPSSGGTLTGESKQMVMRSDLGFATIESVSAPSVMMAPAPAGAPPAPGTSAAPRSMTPSPASSGASSSGASSPSAAGTMAPSREPVTMTVANPFRTTFLRALATLHVDDAVVSTRALGTLLPGQRRTVAFTDWSPPRPGTYRLRVDLKGFGTLGNPLTSSATSTITVAGTGATPRMAPKAGGSAGTITATRSLTPLVRSVSSPVVRPFVAAPRGLAGGTHAVRPLMAGPALKLTANDIVLRPFPPAAGSPMAVTVQVSNVDRTPVRGARVAVRVGNEPLGEAVIDVPASGVAIASGFKNYVVKQGRHDVHASITVGSHRSEATKPLLVLEHGARGFGRSASRAAGGNPAVGKTPGLAGGIKPGFGPRATGTTDLQIQTADIRFAPSPPSAGAAMTVTIHVRNLGASPASDGRVLAVLTAAGVEVARKQFSAAVPAGGMLALEWPLTAPAGTPVVVTATATARADNNPANNQARATTTSKVPLKTKTLDPSRVIGTTR